MPNPIGGAYPVPGDLGQRLKGIENAVAQLQRLMMRLPNPQKETGVAGPFGQTMAIPTNTVVIGGSGGSLNVTSWSFSNEMGGTPPVLLPPSGGMNAKSFAFSEDGWYRAHILLNIGWASGAPPYVRVTTGRAKKGFTSAQFSYEVPCVAGDASGLHSPSITGCFVSIPVPEQFYTAADYCYTILVQWNNTATPTDAKGSGVPTSRVDITRVG